LKQHAGPFPAEVELLAGLAGLVGHGHQMAQLLAKSADEIDFDRPLSGEAVDIPPPLARTTASLLAYAYMRGPVDSLRTLSKRAHDILNTLVPPERRALMHQTGLDRVARMSFPLVGADEVHTHQDDVMIYLQAQRSLVRGRIDEVRRTLRRTEQQLQFGAISDYSNDGILSHAQLYLAIGDSAQAIQLIDRYLANIAEVARNQFDQPYQPVTLVHLMILRAELAEKAGHRAIARKWARAVIDLWQESDNEFKPLMRRMRSIARFNVR
jgi:hypothetical protein